MSSTTTRRAVLRQILGGVAAASLPEWPCEARPSDAYFADGEIEPHERTAMREVAEAFRREFHAPGLSVAIARDGRLAYAQAFGTTGPDSREMVTPSHLFRIASVSKPITSAAIFGLIENGRLRNDDTVFGKQGILGTKYGKQAYGPGIEKITVDHLLTHSCGGWDNGPGDPMFSFAGAAQQELISWAMDHKPLKHPPGTVFAYSNFGYCVLGRVLEEVTGQPYVEFVQKTVLAHCGITDMRIGGNTLNERLPNEVTYYGQPTGDGESHYDDPYAINVTRMDSHGGWVATPTDLVRFATHVDGFEPRRNILKPETIRAMTTASNVNAGYARGWAVNTLGHWWHGGDLGGTTAILVRTASHFCWAALCNTRRQGSPLALDDLIWTMAKKVGAWRGALEGKAV